MNKVVDISQAVEHVQSGMTLMIGGFLGVGSPEKLIDALIAKEIKDITLICNDTSFADQNIGKLIAKGCVTTVYTSHIGTNTESGRRMLSGELDVKLVPQGTLAEQIRAAGAGLGGIITPTGLGTVVELGKTQIEMDGKLFLVEKPLRADVALIKGYKVDGKGNIVYNRAARNFNPLMAMAADVVIVEADEIVETGALDPDWVHTPGIFVNYIVKGGDQLG